MQSTIAPSSIKINWDAALDGQKKIVGTGIVARDCLGVAKAAMCAVIPYIRDPTMAESHQGMESCGIWTRNGFIFD